MYPLISQLNTHLHYSGNVFESLSFRWSLFHLSRIAVSPTHSPPFLVLLAHSLFFCMVLISFCTRTVWSACIWFRVGWHKKIIPQNTFSSPSINLYCQLRGHAASFVFLIYSLFSSPVLCSSHRSGCLQVTAVLWKYFRYYKYFPFDTVQWVHTIISGFYRCMPTIDSRILTSSVATLVWSSCRMIEWTASLLRFGQVMFNMSFHKFSKIFSLYQKLNSLLSFVPRYLFFLSRCSHLCSFHVQSSIQSTIPLTSSVFHFMIRAAIVLR